MKWPLGERRGASSGTKRAAAVVVAPQTAGSVPERMMAVQVPADEDTEAGARAPAGLLGDLQGDAVGRDDIVAADHAFLLDAEDLVEVDAGDGHEGGGGI